MGLEAVSQNDKSVSRSDCIELQEISRNEKKGLYTFKVKLLQDAKDILIRPVCMLLPAVSSYTPAVNTQVNHANTVIMVNFNIPMEDESVTPANSLFNYNNISITCDNYDQDMTDYFEPPVFDSKKKTLTIKPKPAELSTYIGEKPFIELTITFLPDIKILIDNKEFSIKQDEKSTFRVRYNAQMEETKPREIDNSFFATSEVISLNDRTHLNNCSKFHQKKIEDIYSYDSNVSYFTSQTDNEVVSKLMQNRVTDHFYIYGKYYDKDSGVKKVVVTQEGCDPKEYTASSDNVEFISDDNGYTEFIIRHDLKKTNDSYDIEVVVLDGCGNDSESENFFVISRSSYNGHSQKAYTNHYLNYESGEINCFVGNQSSSLKSYYSEMSVEDFLDEYEKNSKNLKVYYEYFFLRVYRNLYIHDRNVELYCEYTDKDGNPRNEPFNDYIDEKGYWCVDLDVDSIIDTEFTIHVIDEYGVDGFLNFEPSEKNYIYPRYESGERKGIGLTNWDGFVITKDGGFSRTYSSGQGTIDVDEDNIAGLVYWNDKGIYSDYIEVVKLDSVIDVSSDYVAACDEFNHLNITFTFGQNTWKNFDFIHCIVRDEYNSNFPYDGFVSFEIYPEDTYIDTQTNKVIYTCKKLKTYYSYANGPEFYLFGDNIQFVFIGAKSCYIPDQIPDDEYPAIVTINPLTEADYDEMPPEIIVQNSIEVTTTTNAGYNNSKENRYITFTLQDVGNGSGPKNAVINVGGKYYELNAENNYQKKFSSYELYNYVTRYNKDGVRDYYKFNYSYEAYDNKGNKKSDDTFIEWNVDNYLKISTYSSDTKKIRLSSSNSNGCDAIKVFVQSGNKYWGELTNVNYNSGNTDITIPDTSSNTFANKWIKVSAVQTVMGTWAHWTHNPPSVYKYTGSIPNSKGKYNYMTKNGNSKDSMVITSDAPVYVCTITTDYDYEKCKDWNAQDWTFFGKEVDRAFLSVEVANPVSDTVPVSQKYQIDSTNYNAIPSGQYYVIIAYFANDDAVMSEIMQK